MKIKDINPYISGNFSEINKRLDEKEFEKYYQKWMSKYNTYFKNINDEKIVELGIRKWKALKEIFASATLFCEAEKAYKYKCEASMFFSLYYSLFHAQLACLYYETNLSFDELLHISHTKLGKVFEESFSKGKKSIVDNNLPNYFESLRDLREYYSYALPMNTLSYDTDIFEKTKLLIIQCYQVTLLQSLLLEISSDKNKMRVVKLNANMYSLLRSKFKLCLTRPIGTNTEYDPADQNVLDEMISDGLSFESIPIVIEHTFDELRTYSRLNDDDEDDEITSSDIFGFIYKSIM